MSNEPANPAPISPNAARRKDWVIRKFDSHEALRRQQILDWQRKTGAERSAAAWEMVKEYWIDIKGLHPDELRLQRVITKIRRGGS